MNKENSALVKVSAAHQVKSPNLRVWEMATQNFKVLPGQKQLHLQQDCPIVLYDELQYS